MHYYLGAFALCDAGVHTKYGDNKVENFIMLLVVSLLTLYPTTGYVRNLCTLCDIEAYTRKKNSLCSGNVTSLLFKDEMNKRAHTHSL